MKLFRNNMAGVSSVEQQLDTDACPGFDHALSQKLDRVISQLDQQPRGLQWAWLRLQKLWLERKVPV